MSDLHADIRALHGPILVTGASGFVGANLYRTLAAVRDDVYGVVRRAKNWRLANIGDENIVAADLNDFAAIQLSCQHQRSLPAFISNIRVRAGGQQ